jgi:hypothetical protein
MMDKLAAGCLYIMVIGSLFLLVDAYLRTGPLLIPGLTNTSVYLLTFFVGLIGLKVRSIIKRRNT